MANKKGVSFCLDAKAVSGVYNGDPTRVRQILYNLVSNALKFTDTGEIRITARRLQNGVEFKVTDSGIGMSAVALDRLFEKFQQADTSTTPKMAAPARAVDLPPARQPHGRRDLHDVPGGARLDVHGSAAHGLHRRGQSQSV